MENYKNLNGRSGVTAFEVGEDYIFVKFGNIGYLYTYSITNIEEVNKNERTCTLRQGPWHIYQPTCKR